MVKLLYMAKNKKRIVVLGGGFAGLECTRKLESHFRNDSEIEIILVSEDNFLLFTPMLPQVASGMIETRHIVMPIRTLCERAISAGDQGVRRPRQVTDPHQPLSRGH